MFLLLISFSRCISGVVVFVRHARSHYLSQPQEAGVDKATKRRALGPGGVRGGWGTVGGGRERGREPGAAAVGGVGSERPRERRGWWRRSPEPGKRRRPGLVPEPGQPLWVLRY